MGKRFFRVGAAVLALPLLKAPTAWAGYVVHDGVPGIVATGEGVLLDTAGRAWGLHNRTWSRVPERDAPMPVSEIKFWGPTFFITMQNEAWMWGYGSKGWGFYRAGPWPGGTVNIQEKTRGGITARLGDSGGEPGEEK